MKRFSRNLAVRFAAVCASVVAAVLFVLSAAAIIVMLSFDTYFDNGTQLRYKIYDISASDAVDEILHAYIEPLYYSDSRDSLPYLSAKYRTGGSSIAFTFTDDTGSIIFESKQTEAPRYSFSETITLEPNGLLQQPLTVHLNGSVVRSVTARDKLYYLTVLTDYIISRRYRTITVCVLSFVLLAALIFFLLCEAGHRNGTDEPILAPLDHLPLDILAVILYGIGLLCARALYFAYALLGKGNPLITLIMIGIFIMLIWLLLLGLILSFTARAKCGDWWKNTVICRVLSLLIKGIKILYAGCRLHIKAAMLYAAVTLTELIIILSVRSVTLAVVFAAERVLSAVLLAYCVHDLDVLLKDTERLAAGDYTSNTASKTRLGVFKQAAGALDSVGSGLKTALEERTKAERLRTELITNVSHDLKTPLTSIISYVDLLKKEPNTGENVKQYLDVIDRQSLRLKKLTVDLIEASKAASGSITAELTDLDLALLLPQVIAEYEEKFASVPLEAVTHIQTDQTHIIADPELLWRVLDNLLGNAVKYAMPHTRLYAEVRDDGDTVLVSLLNISREPLGISADELLERFVRGDASRHTEGSGLGLSISQSLTELQHGIFTLTLDGDAFKVELRFPKA